MLTACSNGFIFDPRCSERKPRGVAQRKRTCFGCVTCHDHDLVVLFSPQGFFLPFPAATSRNKHPELRERGKEMRAGGADSAKATQTRALRDTAVVLSKCPDQPTVRTRQDGRSVLTRYPTGSRHQERNRPFPWPIHQRRLRTDAP